MKALRIVLGTALVLAVVYGMGRFFVSELGGGGARSTDPAGVLFTAPPGYVLEERGELPPAAAARALMLLLASRSDQGRLGVHFTAGGSERYWLVERVASRQAVLTELLAGAGGTRVESTWRDAPVDLDRRLAWAAEHGSLEAPGLARGESRNLYH